MRMRAAGVMLFQVGALLLGESVHGAFPMTVTYQLPPAPTGTTYRVTIAAAPASDPDWLVATFVAGASRTVTAANAGVFTETWDGKDDNYVLLPATQEYVFKGIYMPTSTWNIDGLQHSIKLKYVMSAGDALSPVKGKTYNVRSYAYGTQANYSAEQLKPWLWGWNYGYPGDIDVGPNGVAGLVFQRIENTWAFFLLDLNKPIDYDQCKGAGPLSNGYPGGWYESNSLLGSDVVACNGFHLWGAKINAPSSLFRPDALSLSYYANTRPWWSYTATEAPPNMEAWSATPDNVGYNYLYVPQPTKNKILIPRGNFDGNPNSKQTGVLLQQASVLHPQSVVMDPGSAGTRLYILHKPATSWVVSSFAISGGLIVNTNALAFEFSVPTAVANPYDMEMDRAGRFYFCDPAANLVYQFDRATQQVNLVGAGLPPEAGRYRKDRFFAPKHLSVWKDASGVDRLLVVEHSGPGRISEWKIINGAATYERQWFFCQDSSWTGSYAMDPGNPSHVYVRSSFYSPRHLVRYVVNVEAGTWDVDAVWPMDIDGSQFLSVKRQPVTRSAYIAFPGGSIAVPASYSIYRVDDAAPYVLKPSAGLRPDVTGMWWHDADGDGAEEAGEYTAGNGGAWSGGGERWGDNILDDLTWVISSKSNDRFYYLKPTGFDAHKNPIYDGQWVSMFRDEGTERKATGTASPLYCANEGQCNFTEHWAFIDGDLQRGFHATHDFVQMTGSKPWEIHNQFKLTQYVPTGYGSWKARVRVGQKTRTQGSGTTALPQGCKVSAASRVTKPVYGITGVMDRRGVYHLYTEDGLYVDMLGADRYRIDPSDANLLVQRYQGGSGMYLVGDNTSYGMQQTHQTSGKVYLFMGRGGMTMYECENWRPGLATRLPVSQVGGTPKIHVGQMTVDENAGTAEIPVTLSGTAAGSVVVNYATTDGSAMAGSDYIASSGTLTWSTGQTGPKTISVALVNDAIAENPEVLGVALSGAAGASLTAATGTVLIADDDGVAIQNVRPIAVNDGPYPVNEDAVLSVTPPGVRANDIDSDGPAALTVEKLTDPAHGTVTVNADGSFTYVPSPDWHGTDSFTYRVFDGMVYSFGGGNVTITVAPVNDAPVAGNDAARTAVGVPVTLDVLANDADVDAGDTLTVAAVTQGAHGAVVKSGSTVIYTPAGGWSGVDTFTYTITDIHGAPATAQVTVTVYAPSASVPSDIPGLVLHLDAREHLSSTPDGSGPAPAHGAAVAFWGDRTDSLNNAEAQNVLQSDVARQPRYDVDWFNGNPALRFDGGDYLENTLDRLVDTRGQARTVVMVGDMDDAATSGALFTFRRSTQLFSCQFVDSAGALHVYADGVNANATASLGVGSSATYLPVVRSPFISVWRSPGYSVNDGTHKIKLDLNGTARIVTQTWGVTYESGTVGFQVGARAAASHWRGAVAEIFVYNHQLTQDEVNRLGFYLENKYGVGSTYTDPGVTRENPADWPTGFEIAFPGYSGSETLQNFPCLVKITPAHGIYSAMSSPSNGADLRFIDGADSFLPFEIEKWNASGDSFVWVKIPALNASTTIGCRVGKVGAVLPSYATDGSVWDSKTMLVRHMEASAARDWTAFNDEGNAGVAVGSPTLVAGPIGDALDFDPDGDYVRTAEPVKYGMRFEAFEGGPYTVSAWIRPDAYQTHNAFVGCYSGGSSGFMLSGYTSGTQDLSFWRQSAWARSGFSPPLGQWTHVAYTRSGAVGTFFVNGVPVKTVTAGNITHGNTAYLEIGGGGAGYASYRWDGKVDEARFAYRAHSADWIKACYDSQIANAAFISIAPSGGAMGAAPRVIAGDAAVPAAYEAASQAQYTVTDAGRPQEGFTVVQPGTYIMDANSRGSSVGYALWSESAGGWTTTGEVFKPFESPAPVQWPSSGAPLNDGGRKNGYAFGISERELYAAGALQHADGSMHAVVWMRAPGKSWEAAEPEDLGSLGLPVNIAMDVNDQGEVVGSCAGTESGETPFIAMPVASASGQRGHRWKMQALPTLGGGIGRANSVNNAGVAVGWSKSADGAIHAVLWDVARWEETDDILTDLNAVIAPGSGWELREARKIDPEGVITGTGLFQGQWRTFVVSPSK